MSKQYSFRLPEDDVATQWIQSQENLSVSLRLLIRHALAQSGATDFPGALADGFVLTDNRDTEVVYPEVERPVKPKAKRGRPKKTVDSDVGQVEGLFNSNQVVDQHQGAQVVVDDSVKQDVYEAPNTPPKTHQAVAEEFIEEKAPTPTIERKQGSSPSINDLILGRQTSQPMNPNQGSYLDDLIKQQNNE